MQCDTRARERHMLIAQNHILALILGVIPNLSAGFQEALSFPWLPRCVIPSALAAERSAAAFHALSDWGDDLPQDQMFPAAAPLLWAVLANP